MRWNCRLVQGHRDAGAPPDTVKVYRGAKQDCACCLRGVRKISAVLGFANVSKNASAEARPCGHPGMRCDGSVHKIIDLHYM
jgi:hypothetical protein